MGRKRQRTTSGAASASWLRAVYPHCGSLKSYCEAWLEQADNSGNSMPLTERKPLLQDSDSPDYAALLNDTLIADFKEPAAAIRARTPGISPHPLYATHTTIIYNLNVHTISCTCTERFSMRQQSSVQELLDRAIKHHLKSATHWTQRNLLSLGYRTARYDAHVQVLRLQVCLSIVSVCSYTCIDTYVHMYLIRVTEQVLRLQVHLSAYLLVNYSRQCIS